MRSRADGLNYVVTDAAGNIVMLVDAGDKTIAVTATQIRQLVRAGRLTPRVDIVTFVSRVDDLVCASFWNPDGTPEKMCGNACRSVPLALRLWQKGGWTGGAFPLLTSHCRVYISLRSDGSTSLEFPIDSITVTTVPGSRDVLVDVGTPHRVREVEALFSEEVNNDGKRLSTGRAPVNATFCKVTEGGILARTFERGVGETKSCGTGAIAAMLAMQMAGAPIDPTSPTCVRFASGHTLQIERNEMHDRLVLTGQCEVVTSGVLPSTTFRPQRRLARTR